MEEKMKNFTDLTGRKAIVTGGTRGLGYGMAEGLMEAGAEVVIVGSSAKAEAVADEFTKKGFCVME
jgi:2-deoxy-D-gluconate 3-dehydrogenase